MFEIHPRVDSAFGPLDGEIEKSMIDYEYHIMTF